MFHLFHLIASLVEMCVTDIRTYCVLLHLFQLITSLVEMGFYDLDRIRELYRRYGNNCNEIASHLLDGAL